MKIVEGGKKEVEPRSGCPDTPTNDDFLDWYKKNTPRSKDYGTNCAEVFLGARKGPVNAAGRLGPGSGTLRDDWEDWNVQGVTLGNNGWENNIMGEYVTSENVQLYIKEERTAVECEKYNFLFKDTGEDCYYTDGEFRSIVAGFETKREDGQRSPGAQGMTFYYDLGDGKIEADFFVPREV